MNRIPDFATGTLTSAVSAPAPICPIAALAPPFKAPFSAPVNTAPPLKKSLVCLAADMTSVSDLINLIKEVGPYISVLKTHVDLVQDFTQDEWKILTDLAEKYELLFTINQKDFDKVKNSSDLSVIGHISNAKNGVNLVTKANQKIPITSQGWNSF